MVVVSRSTVVARLRQHVASQGRTLYCAAEDGLWRIAHARTGMVRAAGFDPEEMARSLGLVGEHEVVEPDPPDDSDLGLFADWISAARP